MSQKALPQDIERKASLYQGDGLLDIGLGLGLIFVSLGMHSDWMPSMAGVLVIFYVFVVKAAKKWITVPRMSNIDFTHGPQVERREKRSAVIIAVLVAVLLLLGLLAILMALARPSWLAWSRGNAGFIRGLIGILVVGLLGLAAWVTGAKRLLVYMVLAVVVWIVTLWSGVDFLVLLAALGAVILVTGIVILAQFLRKYPVHPA